MTTAVLVLARMLHIGSAMLLVALPFFTLVILQADFSDGKSQRRSRFFCKMIRWFWLCLLLEALSGLLWFWLVAAQMSDHSPWQLLDAADLKRGLMANSVWPTLAWPRGHRNLASRCALFHFKRENPVPLLS